MFDPDSDSAFAQAQGREPRNYVKFYRQWVRNNFKSKEQGTEVGEHQDFIIIISPGQPKSEVRRKASDADKMSYRAEWTAYEAGKEHQVSGTPIELLPGIPSGMADALKALYIYTIEQMASLPDIALQKVGMGGNEIRQKAQAFMSKNTAEVSGLKGELQQARDELAELRERLAAIEAAPKRGRKPKLQAVA